MRRAGSRPGQGAERYAPVAEQAQRAQQLAQHLLALGDRLTRIRRLSAEDNKQMVALAVGSDLRLLRRALQGVRMGDQEAPCQRQLL